MSAPRVVLASGHMVDLPDRAIPRFPADQVPRVIAEVRGALAVWGVGPGSTVVCGGARGADLIVAEEAHARGARILLCLALPRGEFERRSVDIPGTDWVTRFGKIAGAAEIRVLGDAVRGGSDDVFARANAWMVDVARELDPSPYTIVVWNGRDGDGSGGTGDMVRRLGVQGPDPRVRVVDPTRRAYEARQDLARPKRMLSLDGGGMRGVLSLEVLAAIEARLRDRFRNPRLVLADYFDYIAGTSTGAIIATALALGNSVEQV